MGNQDRITEMEMTPILLLGICQWFENAYGLTSPEFYARYANGEFRGVHDAIRWAGYWRAYRRNTMTSDAPVIEKGISEELQSAIR